MTADLLKPRVLVADDARLVRATITQHIRDRYDVREANDGEAAWQAILLDSSIRVVISDLTMPRVDGYELLSRVRSSKVQRIRDLPVVVLSGADEAAERDKAAAMGATDFIEKGASATELLTRLDTLVRLVSTREALVETQAQADAARTVDPDTELLSTPFFDKQLEKLVSYARRNLSDVAAICVRIELTLPKDKADDAEFEGRLKLVGRTLAASIRLEDLGTRTGSAEFCVATPAAGLSGVLRFAARLRKVLENVEAAGPGVEVWTSIGVATLSEELRRNAEELRELSQKRAQQAQQARSRRIVLGSSEGVSPSSIEARSEEGTMDVNLALELIRVGRAGEVVPHLPRIIEQISPLLKLVRQQRELHAVQSEGGSDDKLQGVPRPVDP
ncbi:MAG TPA: response regulator [Burkholderiaceae bacterium]|jgi:diguanylate cyclase (GGDEF)-like protein|nr:response regulator [Burkholderiaceae bacterium]HPE02755.1 response regulator [Burkholderiaceae bacterium]